MILEVMFLLRWTLSSRYRNTRFLFKRYEAEQMWANTTFVGYTNADLESRFKIKRRREQE